MRGIFARTLSSGGSLVRPENRAVGGALPSDQGASRAQRAGGGAADERDARGRRVSWTTISSGSAMKTSAQEGSGSIVRRGAAKFNSKRDNAAFAIGLNGV